MTVEEVEAAVTQIAASVGDDEVAHSQEDGLLCRVLLAIAGGAPDPAALARAALKTKEIEFARWCA